MPTVSVILPFYNRISLLVDSVQSVLDQTFRDFELILVDGASTEDVSALPLDDPRIRYVREARNTGTPSTARNIGLDLAVGEYIAFQDSDDLFVPEKIERQLGYMQSNSDVLFTHTSYEAIDAQGEVVDEVRYGSFPRLDYRTLLLTPGSVATPTVMLQRDALTSNTRFHEGVFGGEDLMFWISLSKISPIFGIDEVLTLVRRHDENFSNNHRRMIDGLSITLNQDIIETHPFVSTFRRFLLTNRYFDMWYEDDVGHLWDDAGEGTAADRTGDREDGSMMAESDAETRDLRWVLARLADRLATQNRELTSMRSSLTNQVVEDPRVTELTERVVEDQRTIEWLHREVADRDTTISWLHEEVAKRDEVVVSLHGEVAQRDQAITTFQAETLALRHEIETLRQRLDGAMNDD